MSYETVCGTIHSGPTGKAPSPTDAGRCHPGRFAVAFLFCIAAADAEDNAGRAPAPALFGLSLASASERGPAPCDLATRLAPATVAEKYAPVASRFSLYAAIRDCFPELVPPGCRGGGACRSNCQAGTRQSEACIATRCIASLHVTADDW